MLKEFFEFKPSFYVVFNQISSVSLEWEMREAIKNYSPEQVHYTTQIEMKSGNLHATVVINDRNNALNRHQKIVDKIMVETDTQEVNHDEIIEMALSSYPK